MTSLFFFCCCYVDHVNSSYTNWPVDLRCVSLQRITHHKQKILKRITGLTSLILFFFGSDVNISITLKPLFFLSSQHHSFSHVSYHIFFVCFRVISSLFIFISTISSERDDWKQLFWSRQEEGFLFQFNVICFHVITGAPTQKVFSKMTKEGTRYFQQ